MKALARSSLGSWRHRLAAILFAVCWGAPAHAQLTPTFTASANQPLQYGKVVTSGGGSITISPDGAISENGVVPVSGLSSTPAEYTLTYNKGLTGLLTTELIIQITLVAPSGANTGGISGTLSGFTTDLPGYSQIQPGQTLTYTLYNCFTPTCTVTFHIGGTLNIATSGGGGTLTFPLVVMATVTQALL
jgi:hypothetical protein